MDTTLWVAHLEKRLTPKLARLSRAHYATAISENLVTILEGFRKGWTPEQVANEIFAIEKMALGDGWERPLEPPK
jgi:hypothetical protein